MEVIHWLFSALRTVFVVFPLEVATTLGLVFFGLSWVHRRAIVTLPSGQRLRTLVIVGTGGTLAVLAVATLTSWLPTLAPVTNSGGWWQRPAPLVAVMLVLFAACVLLLREPRLTTGERAVAPRRRWWSYAPAAPLWTAGVLAFLLFITVVWQISIGVSLPEGADRYGIGPDDHGIPAYMELHQGFGYVWGAGWPNHLATLIALVLTLAVFLLTLSVNAYRSVFATATAINFRQSQFATAQILTFMTLGGVLLTLGAVWAFVGFNGDRSISVGVPETDGTVALNLGTGYQDIAEVMHLGGYVVQGLGAALLMRLAVDVWREFLAKRPALRKAGLPTAAQMER